MENLSVSSQIREFSRTRSTAIATIRIGSIRIKTIPGMIEEEIKKEEGNQNASQTLGLHEKEVEAEPDQNGRKTFWKYRRFRGGFGGGGESSSARKAYARQLRDFEVYSVQKPPKSQK
jgi:hypothetical protein